MIDTDLGISGKWGRPGGVHQLVAQVASARPGSSGSNTRLARSNADWPGCWSAPVTGTLIADADGVYDPADLNDRLLLGFKGTMSEGNCT